MPAVEPLNTIPLQQFISTVKSAENSRAKEIKIDIMTKLIKLNNLYKKLSTKNGK